MSSDADQPFWKGPREFAMTRWSLVSRARSDAPADRSDALNDLCTAYWYPVYAFIRRKGKSAEAAQDLAQEFLADWMASSALERVDEAKGKFRTFLLRSLEHFLIDQTRRDKAQKRGGNITHIALDGLAMEARYRMEPLTTETPETLYDRHFAETVLARAMERLTKAANASPRAAFTLDLLPHVTGELPPGVADEIGNRHGLTGGAVSAALHRLRGQWKKSVREEVLETTGSPEAMEEEMRHLFASLIQES
jgi:DNA-directed RNA polymerase specialized sigma24 family protein